MLISMSMERRLGPYILQERIGAGGMGEVFRAVKTGSEGFEKTVAVKLILPHLAAEERFRELFSNEAALAAGLNHPNIVNVHGYSDLGGTLCMEMEFIDGVDLRRILRSLPENSGLPTDEAALVMHGVARGLAGAHNRSGGAVAHRDLNPHNIMVSRQGEIKVTDFGISRAMGGDSLDSATLRGKLAYMSPEQLEGRGGDHRSDLFALGVVAFQVLTGRHPFQRGSEAAMIEAIQSGARSDLGRLRPEAAELAPTVHALLSMDPQERPAELEAVIEVFAGHYAPGAISSLGRRVEDMGGSDSLAAFTEATISSPAAADKTAGKRPKAVLVAILAAAILGLVLFSVQQAKQQPQKAAAPAPPASAAEAAAKPATGEFILRSDPPGARVVAGGDQLGQTPLRVEAPAAGVPLRLELYGYETAAVGEDAARGGSATVRLTPLPTGRITVSAIPWADVYYRGRKVGVTPVTVDRVPVGRRQITLKNGPLGVTRTVTVDVTTGANRRTVDLTAPAR